MLPSPTEILYFNEIAKTSNLSRAAERLGVTQPTLSLALKRLEDTIGMPLMIRSKTGVQLTRAGQKLLTKSLTILENSQRLLMVLEE